MQLLNFPMISILPICIFSINRTANRETTDCWRGRRQGRSLRIRPHPAGVAGRVDGFPTSNSFKLLTQILKAQGGPPLPPAPSQKSPKKNQKSNQKKVQNSDSNYSRRNFGCRARYTESAVGESLQVPTRRICPVLQPPQLWHPLRPCWSS